MASQIDDENTGAQALESIHRFRDWLPENAVMLDWLESFYAHHVFGIELQDQVFPIISEMLGLALAAANRDPELREGARRLREINEDAKRRKAQLFQEAADRLRAENLLPNDLDQRVRRDIALAIEQRVGAAPGTQTEAQIEQSLAAYCEFHRQSVLRAIGNPCFRFNSRQHLNDHFDGEQLLYLAAPEHHFITSDGGFDCVTNTLQGPRVHIIAASVLRRTETAAAALERVITGCTAVRPAH